MAQSKDSDLGAIAQMEFLKDSREIVLDRLLRVGELHCDLLVTHSHCDITHNLYLFRLEGLYVLIACKRHGETTVLSDDHAGHLWCHKDTARAHRSDSFGDLVDRRGLEQVALCAVFHRLQNMLALLVHRQYQYLDLWKFLYDLLRHNHAIDDRHMNIHQYHIRAQLAYLLQRIDAIDRLPHNLHILL